ncbi:LOB domain-containing protein 21 [Euphorbia peplus]|nr:LOB domain-containing protein 21 [Euphorbia peplus]
MRSYEPRSSSSCAACKLLKRRCIPDCIFAPYFRSDEPKKFAKVHKVFGASNVSKILIEVPEQHRQETVNSLAFEAEARLRDPVYGCIGAIAFWETKMFQLQCDLALARARLARVARPDGSDCPSDSARVDGGLSGLVYSNMLDGFSSCGGGFVDSFTSQGSSEFIGTQDGFFSSDSSEFPYVL